MEGGVLMICGTLGSRTARDGLTAQSVGVPCKRVPNPCGQRSRSGGHLSAGGEMECVWRSDTGHLVWDELRMGTSCGGLPSWRKGGQHLHRATAFLRRKKDQVNVE